MQVFTDVLTYQHAFLLFLQVAANESALVVLASRRRRRMWEEASYGGRSEHSGASNQFVLTRAAPYWVHFAL